MQIPASSARAAPPVHATILNIIPVSISYLFSCLKQIIIAMFPPLPSSSLRCALLDAIDTVSSPTYFTGLGFTSSESPMEAALSRSPVAAALDAVDKVIYEDSVNGIIADFEAAALVHFSNVTASSIV
jgi:hypothetical protein